MDLELLKEKAGKIKLLAFDVDGVMTDGSITYDENGIEYKTFNAKDGHGLAKMTKNGFITEVFQGVRNKLPILEAIMQKYELDFSQVSYMGDDEPDICILEKVAISACPADAVDKVKQVCNFHSSLNGGRGAVRQLCDFIFDNKID